MFASPTKIPTVAILVLGLAVTGTCVNAQEPTSGPSDQTIQYAPSENLQPGNIVQALMTTSDQHGNPAASIVQRHSVQVVAPPERFAHPSGNGQPVTTENPQQVVVNRMRAQGGEFETQNSANNMPNEPRPTNVMPAGFQTEQEFADATQPTGTTQWMDDLNSRMAAAESNAPLAATEQTAGFDQESFIQRERATETTQPSATRDMLTKIGINLMFVLAVAFGSLLLIKNWQRSRFPKLAVKPEQTDLNVSQVLPLSNGATLHVVDGLQNRFLVAIDASGIKSVNVVSPSFEETLQHTEERDSLSQRAQRRNSAMQNRRHEEPESTPDIDQNLINLLLRNSKQAA